MGFLLFVIALFFTSVLTIIWIPISIPYYIITFRWRTGLKRLDRYFYQLAIVIDIFGNESLQTVLNKIMTIRSYYPFGDDDRNTISYAIAKNRDRDSLSGFGRFWGRFLDKVDKDHLDKAIQYKFERDLRAINRLRARGYEVIVKPPSYNKS